MFKHTWIAILALLFALCTPTQPVTAHTRDELVTLLARYGVNEASFHGGDHLALWEVLEERAWGPLWDACHGDIRCSARLYSAGRSERLTPRVGRILAQPQHQARWQATLRRARRWLAGEIKPLCRYRPVHWGGMRLAVDRERARRALREGRWRSAECYDPETRRPTRNDFFCISGECVR
jgi:hypothetical protein